MKTVIRTQADAVILFDENDRQIPGYQGSYEEVKELILRNAAWDTVFKHWYENAEEPEIVSRSNW